MLTLLAAYYMTTLRVSPTPKPPSLLFFISMSDCVLFPHSLSLSLSGRPCLSYLSLSFLFLHLFLSGVYRSKQVLDGMDRDIKHIAFAFICTLIALSLSLSISPSIQPFHFSLSIFLSLSISLQSPVRYLLFTLVSLAAH